MHLPAMIDVFHFEVAGARLFGTWHPPKGDRACRTFAVLCSPFGREAAPAQPLERRIAEELAQARVGTLRFDYFGTGDSEGASTEATVERWFTDIHGAVEEARRRSGASEACLVGIRLGALLGAWYGSRIGSLSALCALDPIATGAAQIEETRQLEASGWAKLEIKPTPGPFDHLSLMGIQWSEHLLDGLSELDDRGLPDRPAERIGVFVESGDDVAASPWFAPGARFEGGERVELGTRIRPIFAEGIWPPGRAPRHVADWVGRGCP